VNYGAKIAIILEKTKDFPRFILLFAHFTVSLQRYSIFLYEEKEIIVTTYDC